MPHRRFRRAFETQLFVRVILNHERVILPEKPGQRAARAFRVTDARWVLEVDHCVEELDAVRPQDLRQPVDVHAIGQ